jgi:hypothetical protein
LEQISEFRAQTSKQEFGFELLKYRKFSVI